MIVKTPDAEREHIVRILERTGGVMEGVAATAAFLEIRPSILRQRELGILRSG